MPAKVGADGTATKRDSMQEYVPIMTAPRTLALFNYDWDQVGFARWSADFALDSSGFDLFSFPSNARLAAYPAYVV
jgi:hypothetical protein